MSIDLYLEMPAPVFLRQLMPRIAYVLVEMLGLASPPDLAFQVLENGERLPATSDEIRDTSSPFFLISIVGEEPEVGLLVPSTRASVIMSVVHSTLQYLLGAAVAIALARESDSTIGDDSHLFGKGIYSHHELLNLLKIGKTELTLHQAETSVANKFPRLRVEEEA